MFPVKIFPNVTLSTLFYWFIKKNLTSEMTHDWLLSHNNLGSGVWGYASLPVRVLSQTAGKQNIFSLCGEESRINVERHCSCTPRMPHSNRNNPSFPISSFYLLNPDHKHGNKIYNLSAWSISSCTMNKYSDIYTYRLIISLLISMFPQLEACVC